MQNCDVASPVEKPDSPGLFRMTWDYHSNGNHSFFTQNDWRSNVASGGTVLDYQQWVEHNLNSLLHSTDLNGIDALEIAGCTESDGIVEVIDEGDAEFFSVYLHRPNEGVECICDFNTKKQALEFAESLAAKTLIPVYGNLCTLEIS